MFKSLKLIFKNIKRKKKNSNVVKLCPNCKKSTIYRVSYGDWTVTERFKCHECDYEGVFYLEIDPEEKGEKFIDMEELKKEFPEDLDPQTEIKVEKENLKNILKNVDSEEEEEEYNNN